MGIFFLWIFSHKPEFLVFLVTFLVLAAINILEFLAISANDSLLFVSSSFTLLIPNLFCRLVLRDVQFLIDMCKEVNQWDIPQGSILYQLPVSSSTNDIFIVMIIIKEYKAVLLQIPRFLELKKQYTKYSNNLHGRRLYYLLDWFNINSNK